MRKLQYQEKVIPKRPNLLGKALEHYGLAKSDLLGHSVREDGTVLLIPINPGTNGHRKLYYRGE